MVITFDPVKRAKNLYDRQLDFLDAEVVLSGPVFTVEDARIDYGEPTFSDGRIPSPDGDGGLDPAR